MFTLLWTISGIHTVPVGALEKSLEKLLLPLLVQYVESMPVINLTGQSYEKVCGIMTWEGSFGVK
jgi:hypothetical protein